MIAYIAAPYVRRENARSLMRALQTNGVDILARWLIVDDALNHKGGAQKDLDDIDQCDTLIAYNLPGWKHEGGGRHAEFGYALAQKKRVIVYGEPTIIFHYLNHVEIAHTYADLLELVAPVAAPSVSVAG